MEVLQKMDIENENLNQVHLMLAHVQHAIGLFNLNEQ